MDKETLEEAKQTAWMLYEHVEGNLYSTSFKNGFELGAKWQADRMYSEEDMKKAYEHGMFAIIETGHGDTFEEWFKEKYDEKL